jgi:hypothetical protein
MNRFTRLLSVTSLTLTLTFLGAAIAQNASQKKALVVNGRTADEAVVQIGGRSYVDLEALRESPTPP